MILIFLGSWRSTTLLSFRFPRHFDIHHHFQRARRNHQHHDVRRTGPGRSEFWWMTQTVEIENINRNRQAEPDKDMDEGGLGERRANSLRPPLWPRFRSASCLLRCSCSPESRNFCSFRSVSGDLRHAGFLSALTHRCPDDGQIPLAPTTPEYRGIRNPFVRMQVRFEEAFERPRERYHGLLEFAFIIAVLSLSHSSPLAWAPWS